MNSLPVELLESVFVFTPTSQLCGLATVNSKFFEAATHVLWGRESFRVDANLGESDLDDIPEHRLMLYTRHIRRLHIQSFGKSLAQTHKLLDRLPTLGLGGLHELSLQLCWQLQELSIGETKELSDKTKLLFGRKTKDLVLRSRRFGSIWGILEHMRRLREPLMILHNVPQITRLVLNEQYNYVNAIEALNCMPQLTHLRVDFAKMSDGTQAGTSQNIHHFFTTLTSFGKFTELILIRPYWVPSALIDKSCKIKAASFGFEARNWYELDEVLSRLDRSMARIIHVNVKDEFGIIPNWFHCLTVPNQSSTLRALSFVQNPGYLRFVTFHSARFVDVARANPLLQHITFMDEWHEFSQYPSSSADDNRLLNEGPQPRSFLIEKFEEGCKVLRTKLTMSEISESSALESSLRAEDRDAEDGMAHLA